MNSVLATLVKIIHYLLIGVILYYSIFSPPQKSYISVVIIAVIYISWSLANGDCVITKLEDKLNGNSNEAGFVAANVEMLTGKKITNETATNICNGFFGMMLLISIIRFRGYCL